YTIKRVTFNRYGLIFFFSSRRRHTRSKRDWSSDVCSSDLLRAAQHDRRLGPGLADLLRGPQSLIAVAGRHPNVGDDQVGPVLEEIGRASCRERVERWVVGVD